MVACVMGVEWRVRAHDSRGYLSIFFETGRRLQPLVRCICPPDDVTSCYTEDCLRSSSLATTAAMHLMYYTNDEGHRVYTLKVPPSPAAV